MLNGVLWALCSGAAWRDMPERFGPWSTVYQRFRDWRNCGAFGQMPKRFHTQLKQQGLIDPNAGSAISSSYVRVAERKPPHRYALRQARNKFCGDGLIGLCHPVFTTLFSYRTWIYPFALHDDQSNTPKVM
jgi:hypothetical protein